MKSNFIILLFLFCVPFIFADGNVKELSPEDFDSIVDGSKAALVEFYAPWCGHCKNLAPEYEIVADAFAKNSDVVIAKVDADKHKELGSRFGVSGFPTLKFFPKGSTEPEEYDGGRDHQGIIDFINGKTGSKARVAKAPSDVTILDPTNFDRIVKDNNKNVFVEFYAPWCGHCKSLAPIWEKLSSIYKNDEDVVIANLDSDKYSELGSSYGVTGFPTLKFFPKNDKQGKPYNGGRELADLVSFINLEAGTKRTVNGRLDETAGRNSNLDSLASEFLSSAKKEDLIKKAEEEVKGLIGKNKDFGDFYVKYMRAILKKGKDFVDVEKERLGKIVDSGSVAANKLDEFVIRKNIISQF